MSKKKTEFFNQAEVENNDLSLDLGNIDTKDNKGLDDLDLGLNLEETDNSNLADELPDINLDLGIDLHIDTTTIEDGTISSDAKELHFKDDTEYLMSLITRLNRYNDTSSYSPTRAGNLNKVIQSIMKNINYSVVKAGGSLSEAQVKALEIAMKKLKNYIIQMAQENIQSVGNFEDILSKLGFPLELFCIATPDLMNSLEVEITGMIATLKDINQQHTRSMQILNPQLSESALQEGVHLVIAEKIYYSSFGSEQEVVCPVCHRKKTFTMLKFAKPYKELAGPRKKIFYAVQPMLCDCSSMVVPSEETIKLLDNELDKQFTTEYNQMNIRDEVSDVSRDKKEAYQIFKPNAQTLSLVPGIEYTMPTDDLTTTTTDENFMSSLRDFYVNSARIQLKNDLKIILTNEDNNDIRKRIIIYNGLKKTDNGLADINSLIMGTVSQIPLLKTLVNIKKRIDNVTRNILNISKMLKVLDFLKSDYSTSDEYEKSGAIRYLKTCLDVMYSNMMSLDGDITPEIIMVLHSKLSSELIRLQKQKNELDSALNDGKLIIFEHPLKVFTVVPIYSNEAPNTEEVLSIFSSAKEVEIFIETAKEYIALNCWYKYQVEVYRGRFSNTHKYFKRYEDLKNLDVAIRMLPIVTETDYLDGITEFINVELPALQICIGESLKVNSKYRFIYRVIGLLNSPTLTVGITNLFKELKSLINDKYFKKYDVFDINKFDLYFILQDLGFDEQEVFDYISRFDISNIDTTSLSIRPQGCNLVTYMESYDKLTKYSGDYILYDNASYNILFELKMLDSFAKETKVNMHTKLKSIILRYCVSEMVRGVDLIDSCQECDITKFEDSIYHDYGRICYSQGLNYLKMLMDQIEPVNNLIRDFYVEDYTSSGIKLLSNNTLDFSPEDILEHILMESDLEAISSFEFDVALLCILSDFYPEYEVSMEIRSIVPAEYLLSFSVYTVIFTASIYNLPLAKKYVVSDINSSLRVMKESFKLFREELFSKIPVVCKIKIEKYWSERCVSEAFK